MKNKLAKLIKNKQRLCVCCVRCSFVLFVGTLGLQVVITNSYATKGTEMASLQESADNLGRDISLLRLDLAEVSSMAHIENSAKELGFVEYTNTIAVISSSKFAAVSEY
jgi:hypothetical protein